MCGITGAIWTDPRQAVDAQILSRMTDALRHRGPDDCGYYDSEYQLRPPYEAMPGVALGHRRLSIIDVEGGHQPMSNEDGTVWVVFNGEIYNFTTLRNRLEGAGHSFRTRSDTETIVHLYENEGLDCFSHLNGMFAVAIWDANRRRLVLARDRLGQKPLVYRVEPQRLLFASELKSLLQVPGVPRDIDPSAVDEYLTYQYVPYPNTIFRGIRKVPPGHWATFQDGKLEVKPYWTPQLDRERDAAPGESVDELRRLLTSSVQMRLQSDVPLGAFLSGGVDSSLIVALMQQLSDEPVKTFSIGFPVPEYDETSHARRVATHLGTDHHQFEVQPDGVAILPKLIWHFDEPFGDSSAIPTWYVSELTRQHVTVALTGDGGDELFVGYPRYRAVDFAARLDRLPGVLRSAMASRCWQWLPSSPRQKSWRRRLRRFTEVLGKTPQRRYLEWIAIFNETRRGELYDDGFLGALPDADPFAFLGSVWSRSGDRDAAKAASLTDLLTYLPCDLMKKVDMASMAHGLECRQPFLDWRLVELAASMPLAYNFRHGKGKRMLREAFGDLLPRQIWRRPKMGFGVPLDHWFRHELREMTHDVLLDETALSRGYFRPDAVMKLVNEHMRGIFDHSARLWALLVFELWMREWSKPTS